MAAAFRSPYVNRKVYQRSPYAHRKNMNYAIVDRLLVNEIRPIGDHRYRLRSIIGEGTYGEVYSAQRLPDGKQVAIKVISVVTHSSTEALGYVNSFLQEVKKTKLLGSTSRHFVYIYDFDFNRDGLSFIAMELGEKTLEAAFPWRKASSAERKFLWRQLVEIAMILYKHQTVHLDIKPANLLLFPGNIVKLIDLGIARNARQTRFGPQGTVPYSAPEVTMASQNHKTKTSTKADVWSWGAVLYRLTYGREPDQRYLPPCDRPPADQLPTRDPYLRDLLHHTLQKDPALRPDTTWLANHQYTMTE